MSNERPPRDDFEQCVDTIRDIIHKCNRHQQNEALYRALAKNMPDYMDTPPLMKKVYAEEAAFEECWKAVRPALRKLLAADKP